MRRIALVLAVLAAAAFATTWGEVDVDCPVCAKKFKAREWHSTNSIGGVDRDFCKHAAGGNVFLFACWTCPRCKYTGFQSDFQGDKVPLKLIERLKKENPLKAPVEIDAALKDTEDIPAWVRYDLRYQVLELREGTEPGQLAWVRLRTAHTQRFDWRDTFPKRILQLADELHKKHREDLPKNWYDATLQLARRLEKGEHGRDGRLLAAAFFLSRGESPDAARVLRGLRAEKELPEELAKVVRDFEERIARARKYYGLAIPLYLKVIAAGSENATALRYLVGELYRKVGAKEKAVETLQSLLEDEKFPEDWRDWVEEALTKAKG
jgi:uncharacterized protein (DUF2225 family)